VVWGLTAEDFDRLTGLPCRYCGIPPSKVESGPNGTFIYSGIDRVDNKRGYLVNNTVPCCRTCNQAKHCMNVDDFLSWARRVEKFNEVN
jgi:hypothetical protein